MTTPPPPSAQDCYSFLVQLIHTVRGAKTPEEFEAAWTQVRGIAPAFENDIMQSLATALQALDPPVREAVILLMTAIEWSKIVTLLMTNPIALAGPEVQQALMGQETSRSPSSEAAVELAAEVPDAMALLNQAFSKLDKK